jgi:hypothetical protein
MPGRMSPTAGTTLSAHWMVPSPISVPHLPRWLHLRRQSSSAEGHQAKQSQVLAMLRSPDGATMAQIAEAMTWAPHIVRAQPK